MERVEGPLSRQNATQNPSRLAEMDPYPVKRIALALVLALSGCCSDLQRSYVDAMVATEKVILADIKAGYYTPDARSAEILILAGEANAKADAALKADGR